MDPEERAALKAKYAKRLAGRKDHRTTRAEAIAADRADAAAPKRDSSELLKKGGGAAVIRNGKRFKIVDVPGPWINEKQRFLVIGSVGNIPDDIFARMYLYMKANLATELGIEVSTKDIDAAKGINLLDLIPRRAILPARTFAKVEDAVAFQTELVEQLGCNAQVIQMCGWNVVPPYTTQGKVYPDKEMAAYMKTYASQERIDMRAFHARIKELNKESLLSADKRGTVTQEQIYDEDLAASERRARQEAVTKPLEVPTVVDYEKETTHAGQINALVSENLAIETSYDLHLAQHEKLTARINELSNELKTGQRRLRALRKRSEPTQIDELDYDSDDQDTADTDTSSRTVERPVYLSPHGQWYGKVNGKLGVQITEEEATAAGGTNEVADNDDDDDGAFIRKGLESHTEHYRRQRTQTILDRPENRNLSPEDREAMRSVLDEEPESVQQDPVIAAREEALKHGGACGMCGVEIVGHAVSQRCACHARVCDRHIREGVCIKCGVDVAHLAQVKCKCHADDCERSDKTAKCRACV